MTIHFIQLIYLAGLFVSIFYLPFLWSRMAYDVYKDYGKTEVERRITNLITFGIAIILYNLGAFAANSYLQSILIENYAYWYCGNESPTQYYLVMIGPYGWMEWIIMFLFLSIGIFVSFYRSISATIKGQRKFAGLLCAVSWVVIGCLNVLFMGVGCAISRV